MKTTVRQLRHLLREAFYEDKPGDPVALRRISNYARGVGFGAGGDFVYRAEAQLQKGASLEDAIQDGDPMDQKILRRIAADRSWDKSR
jgi:hypothetical protein